jgi:beta-lactamase superfamily II metal-dependent hydrolase
MKLKVLPAFQGDCFLLSWGEQDEFNLMIDSGSAGTYMFIQKELKKLKKLEAIIITHPDYDHIGGFIKLMDVNSPPIPLDSDVYINTPHLILTPKKNDKVATKHLVQFNEILSEKGITPKGIYLGINESNVIEIEDLKLEILSPPLEIVKKVISEYNAYKLKEESIEESKTSDKVSVNSKSIQLSYDEIISSKEDIYKWEDDLLNSSSIAFIAEYNDKKILFLGDANPDIVYQHLSKKYSKENKLKVDLFKISHHGSKHNTSEKLLEIIDCDSYIISTNGNKYYHPHRETIVRIAEYGRNDSSKKINIYTNYKLRKTNFITIEEEKKWVLNIEKCNEFEL